MTGWPQLCCGGDLEVRFMVLVTPRISRCALLAIVIASAIGLPIANAQTFDLSDVAALSPVNVNVAAAEYKGRKAVLITRDWLKPGEVFKDGFALLKGVDFQDGTIEGEIALKMTAPPGPGRMPGFVGVAFRARPDASHYDLFYLRPGNSTSDDRWCSIQHQPGMYDYPRPPSRSARGETDSGRTFSPTDSVRRVVGSQKTVFVASGADEKSGSESTD